MGRVGFILTLPSEGHPGTISSAGKTLHRDGVNEKVCDGDSSSPCGASLLVVCSAGIQSCFPVTGHTLLSGHRRPSCSYFTGLGLRLTFHHLRAPQPLELCQLSWTVSQLQAQSGRKCSQKGRANLCAAGPLWNSRATVEQPGHHGKAAVRQGRDAKGNRAWSSKLGTLRISPAIILCVLRHRQRTD